MGHIQRALESQFRSLLSTLGAQHPDEVARWLVARPTRQAPVGTVARTEALVHTAELLLEKHARARLGRAKHQDQPLTFLCDAGLGGLARWPRAAGYVARWQETIDDATLVVRAIEQRAVVLSTDSQLLERRVFVSGSAEVFWLPPACGMAAQLRLDLRRWNLAFREPLCMRCSGPLDRVDKETVKERIPPRTGVRGYALGCCAVLHAARLGPRIWGSWQLLLPGAITVLLEVLMRPTVSESGCDLQAWLVLSRVAGLPTVWSNCLAAWVLGGGGATGRLLGLMCGASLVYVGGAWLNDYFDIGFDHQRHPTRPLPSGRVQPDLAGRLGVSWLIIGAVLLVLAGARPAFAVLLVAAAFLYNWLHRATELSPLIMAVCRLLLYVVTASAASDGVTGFVFWCGIAVGAYVGGMAYLGQKEFTRDPVRWWPLISLAAPVVLALVANRGEYREPAMWLSFVLALWVIPCLRHALREGDTNRRLTVSGLTAGIVLVDLLATGGELPGMILAFGALYVLTIGLQRYLPAA